jgi:hypothetical protein
MDNRRTHFRVKCSPELPEAMDTLRQQIIDRFLKRLDESKKFDSAKLEALKKAMGSGNKIKVDQLVEILSMPIGSDLK